MANRDRKYTITVGVKITAKRDESGKLMVTSSEPPTCAFLTERLNDPKYVVFDDKGLIANKDEIQ